MTLDDRLLEIESRIQDACKRAGRSRDDVVVLPVTKGHPPELIDELTTRGFQLFGESKVQEAGIKKEQCSSSIDWHLIGHLQSNKARLATHVFKVIHSIDSVSLMQKLDRAADENGDRLDVYLQVNLAEEKSKYGFLADDIPAALDHAQECYRLNVVGMMLIPPFQSEKELTRPWYARLRELRDQWSKESGYHLEELSMGMSNDYDIAIEEGATIVRLGTCLAGKRSGKI